MPRAQRDAGIQPDRIRNIHTIGQETTIICAVIDSLKRTTNLAPVIVPQPAPVPVIQVNEVKVEVEVPVPIKDISVFDTTELVQELMARAKFADLVEAGETPVVVETEAQSVLTDAALEEATKFTFVDGAVEVQKPKKLIVFGVPAKWRSDLTLKLNDLNVKIIFNDLHHPRLKDLPNADAALIGRTVGTTHVGVIKQKYGNEHTIFEAGGMDKLVTAAKLLLGGRQCTKCQVQIPWARLQALPETTTCVACAEVVTVLNGSHSGGSQHWLKRR